MKTGVIFDMDRTLLILPVNIIAVREALRAWGEPLGLDLPWRPILKDIGSVPQRLAERYGPARAAGFGEEAWDILDEAEAKAGAKAKAREGARELVESLHHAGVPMALVTNNGRPGALAALTQIGLGPSLFKTLICRGEALNPKPAPDAFISALRALEREGPLEELISIGDAPSDVLAAKALAQSVGERLRVWTIALQGGFVTPEALWAVHPDLMVEELTGLWDTLMSAL